MPISYATRAHPMTVTSARRACATSTRLVVAVRGDVDAGNAKAFADQVCALIADATQVRLDLSGLDFIAVDGCTALHAINALVMRKGVEWSVIPSRGVSRVLALCDPACLIPLSGAEELAQPA
jgi:anti-anti-sigma factor